LIRKAASVWEDNSVLTPQWHACVQIRCQQLYRFTLVWQFLISNVTLNKISMRENTKNWCQEHLDEFPGLDLLIKISPSDRSPCLTIDGFISQLTVWIPFHSTDELVGQCFKKNVCSCIDVIPSLQKCLSSWAPIKAHRNQSSNGILCWLCGRSHGSRISSLKPTRKISCYG